MARSTFVAHSRWRHYCATTGPHVAQASHEPLDRRSRAGRASRRPWRRLDLGTGAGRSSRGIFGLEEIHLVDYAGRSRANGDVVSGTGADGTISGRQASGCRGTPGAAARGVRRGQRFRVPILRATALQPRAMTQRIVAACGDMLKRRYVTSGRMPRFDLADTHAANRRRYTQSLGGICRLRSSVSQDYCHRVTA